MCTLQWQPLSIGANILLPRQQGSTCMATILYPWSCLATENCHSPMPYACIMCEIISCKYNSLDLGGRTLLSAKRLRGGKLK